MNDLTLANLLIALGGILVGVLGTWLSRPKVMAETAKAVAESYSLDWARFQSEIVRQDAKIAALEDKLERQEAEIENLKHDRDERDDKLVVERKANKSLRAHVARLEKRLGAIEDIFKRHAVTAEMRAELDSITDD